MKHLKLFEVYKLGRSDVELYIRNTNLTSLPEVPNGTISLNCKLNELTSLPDLPDSLLYLTCDHNQLISLPKLPEGLLELYCYNNKLITLPEIPKNIRWFYCYNNPLECTIPKKYIRYQTEDWINNYYYPFIESYEGQKKILKNDGNQLQELMKQTRIRAQIKKDFPHLFTGIDLNLL